MINYDESILRSRRIQPSVQMPALHQALRIALYDEYAARAFYSKVVEAFGQRSPFVNIARSEEQHIATLSRLADRFGVPRPLDPFPAEMTVAPGWLANCERAVQGEINNVRLYDALLAVTQEPEVRRAFQNLQTASYEHHLPAFREAALAAIATERYHAAQGIGPSQAYVHHGPISDFIEKAFSQMSPYAGPFGLLAPLVRRTHPAMLAGIVAGGVGVYFYRNHVKKISQEK